MKTKHLFVFLYSVRKCKILSRTEILKAGRCLRSCFTRNVEFRFLPTERRGVRLRKGRGYVRGDHGQNGPRRRFTRGVTRIKLYYTDARLTAEMWTRRWLNARSRLVSKNVIYLKIPAGLGCHRVVRDQKTNLPKMYKAGRSYIYHAEYKIVVLYHTFRELMI